VVCDERAETASDDEMIVRRTLLRAAPLMLLPLPSLARIFRHSPGGGYAGLGDIYGPALGYWGLRALNGSAAVAAVKAIQIQRASDNTTLDIHVLGDGNLDLASATTFLAATTGGISIWYDQSGNGYHMAQATQALQPQFAFSQFGSLPAVTFDGATTYLEYAAGIPNTPAPFTYSFFGTPQMSATRNVNYFFTDSVNGGNQGFQVDGSGNVQYIAFFGNNNTVLITNNTAQALQLAVIAGAGASTIRLNGVSTAETFAISTNPVISGANSIGADISGVSGPFSAYFKGLQTELGYFAISPTVGQLAAADSNQRAYW
jgi:hypothetical protein